MTIEQLLKIRHNNLLRDEFLIALTKRNKNYIFSYSRKIAGQFATLDLITNECSQYFMLGANRGIDRAKIIDDGRGKNDPEKYCITSGIYNIRDFLLREFRLNRKFVPQFIPISENEYNFPEKLSLSFEHEILGNIYIEDIFKRLKPLDRQILQLIMYGETNGIALCPKPVNKKISGNLVNTIAYTLGCSSKTIYSRIYTLRGVFSTLPFQQDK